MSLISEYTYKGQYDNLAEAVEGGIQGNPYTFAMNNAEYTVEDGAISAIYNTTNKYGRMGLTSDPIWNPETREMETQPLAALSNKFGEEVFNAATAPITAVAEIVDYMVPSTLALDSFDEMGKGIDELIEESFSLQAFNLKGTEVTCAVFCVLISFLSCSERNRLYENIRAIEAQTLGLAKASEAITETAYIAATSYAMLGDVLNGTSELFSLKNKNKESSTGVGGAIATAIAVPSAISATIDMLNQAISLINGAKITVPVDLNGSLWDYAQNALFLLQGMAVQIADQALSKVISPVEESIKEMQPINCIGNMASTFFNKILDALTLFKQWMLRLIADIFAESKAFNIQFKTCNAHLKYLLEISAFLEALNLLVGRFGDLAIACGVTPCSDESYSPQSLGKPMAAGVTSSQIIPSELEDIFADNIDTLASKLAPILNRPIEEIAVSPTEIKTISSINNLPRKLVNSMDALAKELGSDYKIYINNNNATVVHSFKRTCGV